MHISYVRSENGKIKMKKHKQLTFLNFYLQVMRTLKRALQPVMSDVNVAWDLAKGWTVHQIPSSLPPLFSGDRLVVYGVLKASENANEGDDNEVRLEGMLGNQDEKIKHVVTFSTPPIAVENKTNVLLHQLAAKSFIQEKKGYQPDVPFWNEANSLVVSISKSANVISKFTSFVAVDKGSNLAVSGPLSLPLLDTSESDGGPFDFYSMDTGMLGCTASPPRKIKIRRKRKRSSAKFILLSADVDDSSSDDVDSASPLCLSIMGGTPLKEKGGPRPIMALVTLQKASGSWDLTDQLVSLCGTSRDALINGCPKEIAVDTGEGKLLWATALALVLLMGRFLDQKDEWEMIAEKGTKWMKKNLPAGVKYEIVLEAAATAVSVKIY